MAYFGITASAAGLQAAAPGDDLASGLRRGLEGGLGDRADRRPDPRLQVPPRPARRRPAPLALRASAPSATTGGSAAGPRASASPRTGARPASAIGFAWPASAPHPGEPRQPPAAPASPGSTTGPAAYGARLAELVALLQRLAPGRPVDLLAHSLGARVALAALPHLGQAPGPGDPARRRRVRRPGAASSCARPARRCPPQIYNVTARANDLYDLDVRDASRRAAAGASGRSGWGSARSCPAGSTCSSTAPRSPPGSTPRASR